MKLGQTVQSHETHFALRRVARCGAWASHLWPVKQCGTSFTQCHYSFAALDLATSLSHAEKRIEHSKFLGMRCQVSIKIYPVDKENNAM